MWQTDLACLKDMLILNCYNLYLLLRIWGHSSSRGQEEMKRRGQFTKFKNLRNRIFPGVIGCVDGMHVQIPAPAVERNSYYNRKGAYSVLLQVVCTFELRFLDVFCGWPGSSHDARRVWRMSPLFHKLTTDENFVPRWSC